MSNRKSPDLMDTALQVLNKGKVPDLPQTCWKYFFYCSWGYNFYFLLQGHMASSWSTWYSPETQIFFFGAAFHLASLEHIVVHKAGPPHLHLLNFSACLHVSHFLQPVNVSLNGRGTTLGLLPIYSSQFGVACRLAGSTPYLFIQVVGRYI